MPCLFLDCDARDGRWHCWSCAGGCGVFGRFDGIDVECAFTSAHVRVRVTYIEADLMIRPLLMLIDRDEPVRLVSELAGISNAALSAP
jgi:hypothetical protein